MFVRHSSRKPLLRSKFLPFSRCVSFHIVEEIYLTYVAFIVHLNFRDSVSGKEFSHHF